MYRRLIILSLIIIIALGGLAWLGYHSIKIRADGLEGARLAEFAAVAEQIRQDVKRKLDNFMQIEQNRPYTDYQYYYVPDTTSVQQQQMPLLRSPLGESLENDLAYGNFQVEPDGTIITPYYNADQIQTAAQDELARQATAHITNIRHNLLSVLNGSAGDYKLPSRVVGASKGIAPAAFGAVQDDYHDKTAAKKSKVKGQRTRRKAYQIESLQQADEQAQVLSQPRAVATLNVAQSQSAQKKQVAAHQSESAQKLTHEMAEKPATLNSSAGKLLPDESPRLSLSDESEPTSQQQRHLSRSGQMDKLSAVDDRSALPADSDQNQMVQIRIEPFVPVITAGGDAKKSIFGGQVFLLRHVQIETRHFLQGFKLDEQKLIEEVKESALRFMREGMDFELSRHEDLSAAYSAILDFGFGDLVLNLKEIDPARIAKQITQLRNWYFSIITIVLLAVALGLASLWRNARAHLKLAQKKDDFISAVSHELRAPLTSIRMYAEMLEKNWVKSEDKRAEYYTNMRQESERLSRLIENVLDFSRIQRGRKKYTFTAGDINQCITGVVEMMKPYAAQNGFTIKTDFKHTGQTTFDSDAVTQIVVNLLDNAIKYARNAADKTITIRTKTNDAFTLIEVEDHGPGVPHRQRKKIFEEFYRTEAESTRETAGTGLGLALVKKFAEAHNGFVEILTAKPSGSIFRVTLATQS